LGKIGIEPRKEAPTLEKAVDDFLEQTKAKIGKRTRQRYLLPACP
jgi:hypothetical protein